MAEFQNTIDLLGDEETLDALISGTLTEFCDDKLTELGQGAFAYQSQITTMNLPNLTKAGSLSFFNCKFQNHSLEKLKELGELAFGSYKYYNGTLILPNVETIATETFSSAQIKELYLPSLKQAKGNLCFTSMPFVKIIDIRNIEEMEGSNMFSYTEQTGTFDLILPATPPTVGSNTFFNSRSQAKINGRIPTGSLDAYNAAATGYRWQGVTFVEEDR